MNLGTGTTRPSEAVADALGFIEANPDDHAIRIMAALISDYDHALDLLARAARMLPTELPNHEADGDDDA